MPQLRVVSARPVSVSKNGKVKARKRKPNSLGALSTVTDFVYPGGNKKLTKDATTDPFARKKKKKAKAKNRSKKRKANKKRAAPKKGRKTKLNPHRLKGRLAIAYAEKHGLRLKKYADPTQGARTGLTPSEANRIAREDPNLIYLDTPKRKKASR